MYKEYLIKNNICFLVKNQQDSENIQNYLLKLGFYWFDKRKPQKVNFRNFPILIFPEYEFDYFLSWMVGGTTPVVVYRESTDRAKLCQSASYKSSEPILKYNIIDFTKFIRKEKLKIING